MRKTLLMTAAAALLSLSPAFAHEWGDVRWSTAPLPQGHPHLVAHNGVVVVYPVPRTPLTFGIVDGRRVLLDPLTLRVVYVMRP
jgi:hypothetical protein